MACFENLEKDVQAGKLLLCAPMMSEQTWGVSEHERFSSVCRTQRNQKYCFNNFLLK